MGIGAGGVILLILAFVAEEHVRGRWALNQHLNRLKANGEVYLVAALEPRHPTAEQNGFADLTNIASRLMPMLGHVDDGPWPPLFAAPGKEIVAWRLNQWAGYSNITNDWSRHGQEYDEARELLKLVHAAVQKPAFDSGFDYEKGFVDFAFLPLIPVKRTTQLLQAATLYELHRGHLEAASGHLCAMVNLAADQKPEPLVICQLVRQFCAAMAFNATWEGLQAPGWNDSQLAALQASWEGFDFAKDTSTALRMERAMTFDFYEQIKNSNDKLTFAAGQRFGSYWTHEFMIQWIYAPIWRIAWADQDELRELARWQAVIERERMARSNSWASLFQGSSLGDDLGSVLPFRGYQEEMGWYDRARFLFSSENFSINDAVIRRSLCAQVQQQMAVTAIAIQRYRLQAGKAPADLAALVPKYISALPRDGMDGKTLRYRVESGGGFVLYSVGLDGKDDGGDSTLVTGKMLYRRIWDGRDAVWPAAATEEEALAAMKGAKD